jgi:hypothetical protein
VTSTTNVLRVLASRRDTSRLGLFERLHPEGDALDLEDHEAVVAGLEISGLLRVEGEQVEVTPAGLDYLDSLDASPLAVELEDGEVLELERRAWKALPGPRPGVPRAVWAWPLVLLVVYALWWRACA